MALIDRTEFVRSLSRIPGWADADGDTLVSVADIRSLIYQARTVDAELVVHSFWHWDHDGHVCCDNCKFPLAKTRVNCAGQDKYLYLTTKYCSNCGSKMDAKEGESE